MSEFWAAHWQDILTYGTCLFLIGGFLMIFLWVIPPGKEEMADKE